MKTFKEFRESIGYSTKLEVVEREKIEIFEGDVIDQLRKISKSKKEADVTLKSGSSHKIDPASANQILKTDGSGTVSFAAETDTNTTYTAGTGLDLSSTEFSVDVSDFMSNGSSGRILRATGADAMSALTSITSDGTHLRIADSSKFIAGAGDDLQMYHDGTNNIIKNNKKINFFGFKENISALIKTYDNHNITILPSFTEAHPKVVDESLARGRPVIIFEEINHIIQNKHGVFVSKRNAKSLLEAVSYTHLTLPTICSV